MLHALTTRVIPPVHTFSHPAKAGNAHDAGIKTREIEKGIDGNQKKLQEGALFTTAPC